MLIPRLQDCNAPIEAAPLLHLQPRTLSVYTSSPARTLQQVTLLNLITLNACAIHLFRHISPFFTDHASTVYSSTGRNHRQTFQLCCLRL